MAVWVFWGALLVVVYCYAGYPLLLAALARRRRRPVRKDSIEPTVDVVIAAWNEEDAIGRRLENLLAVDYPAGKLRVLVGSDGSDDRTVEIVRAIGDPRVRLFAFPTRRGKPAVLNDLVAQARAEILVFADARQVFARDAIRQLVANFADPEVGCVSGTLGLGPRRTGTGRGVGLYWRYETAIRAHESALGSMLGATGAIYAVRRRLFEPFPTQVVLDDMYLPLSIVEKGHRAVFDPAAEAYDDAGRHAREEYQRKARTLFGNYQLLSMRPRWLNPLASPVALQLLSHKVLRLLVPFLLLAVLLANVALAGQGLYRMLLGGQLAFYVLALAGAFTRGDRGGRLRRALGRACSIPFVFCLLNLAALGGFWRFVRGRQPTAWQKARTFAPETPRVSAAAERPVAGEILALPPRAQVRAAVPRTAGEPAPRVPAAGERAPCPTGACADVCACG